MPKTGTTYLDPLTLSTIGSLELVAQTVVEGFIAGLHQSPYQGQSVEFTEHRPYFPGDEIRRIDWKAYAKSDKFLVKQYEEETNLKAYLLLDTSSSMAYGGDSKKGLSKLEYGKYLIASLTYLMLQQRDGVGFVGFKEKIEDFIPPRANPAHLKAIISNLRESTPQGETNFSQVSSELAERIKRRGLVIVVSDLINNQEEIIQSLRLLKAQKHEVIVFQIIHPDELNLPFHGYFRFEDPESNNLLNSDSGKLRSEYKQKINSRLDFFKNNFVNYNIDYVLLNTTTPLDEALFHYLHSRA